MPVMMTVSPFIPMPPFRNLGARILKKRHGGTPQALLDTSQAVREFPVTATVIHGIRSGVVRKPTCASEDKVSRSAHAVSS
jgi:hypothetical protein